MNDTLLLLDVGNSSAKWVLLGESGVLHRGHASLEEVAGAARAAADSWERVLVSSVASDEANELLAARFFEVQGSVWFAATQRGLGGLRNSYREPRRMGVDRWLAMLAAFHRSAGACAVVDAGSALTIDFVDASGQHEGGYIIPGAALMERALLLDTDRVRFEAGEAASLAPGCSTEEAVNNGLLLAQVGAVQLAIDSAKKRGPLPPLYLCGGGAAGLAGYLAPEFKQVPDLVLEGLLRQAVLEDVVPGAWLVRGA